VGNEPIAYGRKRKFFDQSPEVPQALPQYANYLQRHLRMREAEGLKMHAAQPQQNRRRRRNCRR
jgi:hypothetical protein